MKQIKIKAGLLNIEETNLNKVIESVINSQGIIQLNSCYYPLKIKPLDGQVPTYDALSNSFKLTSVSSGTTDLGYLASLTNGVITNSSGGTVATIPIVTGTYAGLATSSMFNALSASTSTNAQIGVGNTYITVTDPNSGNIDFVIDGITTMTLSSTKLSLNGILIDPPSGLELMLKSSNPGGIQANTLWLDSANNHLMRGSVDLESESRILDTKLTGFNPLAVATAITATDSVLQSIEKLNAIIENNDSVYLDVTSAETITGVKTFTAQPSGIKATSILLDPVVGMTATNVQEAIQELFTIFTDAFNQPI